MFGLIASPDSDIYFILLFQKLSTSLSLDEKACSLLLGNCWPCICNKGNLPGYWYLGKCRNQLILSLTICSFRKLEKDLISFASSRIQGRKITSKYVQINSLFISLILFLFFRSSLLDPEIDQHLIENKEKSLFQLETFSVIAVMVSDFFSQQFS